MSTPLPRPLFPRSLTVLLAAAALALPALGRAADAKDEPAPSFSDKTSEAFTKLAPMLTAKNWDGALALLNSILPTVEPGSYDEAVIDNTLGGIYVQGKEQPQKAIQPWERMIELSKQHPNYFPAADVTNQYQHLAYIYMQLGTDTKNKDEASKRAYMQKSLENMKRYLDATPKPRSDDRYLYAILLYQRATTDPQNIDKAILHQAKDAAKAALLADIHPKENFYQLLIGADVQDGNLEEAADYIELILKNHPTSKDWWPQLFGIYNNLAANNEKDPELYRKYLARDINTMERAQALGYMKTPVDNMNLVTMYTQVSQYGKATELLYAGLHNHTIDSKPVNWNNLALFYKQIGDFFGAIKVFKEADDNFPDNGEFDLQISDIYNSDLNNTQEAYKYSKMAVAKGNLGSRAYYAYYYLAFEAYELQKYDEALAACDAGMKLPNSSKELSTLRDQVKQTIDNANAQKEALKAQQSQP